MADPQNQNQQETIIRNETDTSIRNALDYQEPTSGDQKRNEIRIDQLWGYFPQVTTTPTWAPTQTAQSVAFDTTTGKIYYYDFTNQAWKSVYTVTQTGWTLVSSQTSSYTYVTGLSGYSEILIVWKDCTASSASNRGFTVSSDGGSTFYTANSDYTWDQSNLTVSAGAFLCSSGTSGAVNSFAHIKLFNISGTYKPVWSSRANATAAGSSTGTGEVARTEALNAVSPEGGVNGGTILVYGKI